MRNFKSWISGFQVQIRIWLYFENRIRILTLYQKPVFNIRSDPDFNLIFNIRSEPDFNLIFNIRSDPDFNLIFNIRSDPDPHLWLWRRLLDKCRSNWHLHAYKLSINHGTHIRCLLKTCCTTDRKSFYDRFFYCYRSNQMP